MNKTGLILLAAGNSSRLGHPKQLLFFRGKTLIAHMIGEAVTASFHPVIVVTGAFATEIGDSLNSLVLNDRDTLLHSPDRILDGPEPALEKTAFQIVYNPRWQDGMASGIAAGLSKMLSLYPDTEAVVIAVCDQPHISAALLRQLVQKKAASGKDIVACAYSDSFGTPVLFGRKYFEDLLQLAGNTGAKKLLNIYKDDRTSIPFPQGNIDIDTEEDYRKLVR